MCFTAAVRKAVCCMWGRGGYWSLPSAKSTEVCGLASLPLRNTPCDRWWYPHSTDEQTASQGWCYMPSVLYQYVTLPGLYHQSRHWVCRSRSRWSGVRLVQTTCKDDMQLTFWNIYWPFDDPASYLLLFTALYKSGKYLKRKSDCFSEIVLAFLNQDMLRKIASSITFNNTFTV